MTDNEALFGFSNGETSVSDEIEQDNSIIKGHSIIDFPTEYICVDTETTALSPSWGSIMEISAKHIINGQVVDSYHSLIKPESRAIFTYGDVQALGYENFGDVPYEVYEEFMRTHLIDDFISSLTGITNEMLLSAPSAKDVIPAFIDFCGDKVIVGQKVAFDISFICATANRLGLSFTNDYIDTLRIARKVFRDKNHHRLIDIAEYCGVDYPEQHRTEADSIVTYKCFEIMRGMILNESSVDDFKQLFRKYANKVSLTEVLKSMTANVNEIDDTNPFFKKTVVFTGALSTMERKDACQIVLNLGGIPEDNLTKKTNYLIIGDSGFGSTVKSGKSSKMLKAEKYIEKGIDISVLSEQDFFSTVNEYL